MKRLRKRKSVLPSVILWYICIYVYYLLVFMGCLADRASFYD